MVAFTESFFVANTLPPDLRNAVDLCVEELFVNMVAYNTETHEPILVELERTGQGIQVALTDFGVERFDPRTAPPVDVTAPVDEREPGGLGLYLVMKMASAIHYEYRDQTSKITLHLDETDNDV